MYVRQGIRELNNQIVQHTGNLSTIFRQEAEGIKIQLDTALSISWDQKPIYFQDAIGRRYPVPLEAVEYFDVWKMTHMLV